MKKILLASLVCIGSLHATNGDNLIGFGAKSRAMGGVGVATNLEAENSLSNPALLAWLKEDSMEVGITYFTPTIKTNGTKSEAIHNFIPHMALAQGSDSGFSYGLGLYGSSGMGVDFRNSNNPALMDARTNLSIMKITPTIAYDAGDFSFGFSPIIQYGSLNISYVFGQPVGMGKSDDFGFGYKAGIGYRLTPALNVGIIYQSAIAMSYKNTLSVASTPFVPAIPAPIMDKLEQPQEFGIGFSYHIAPFTVLADYKTVFWGGADCYWDFGWQDQNVYSVGLKYEKNGTWFGAGYNYAKNPIMNNYGADENMKAVINAFNYIFFPATQEEHFTIGAGTMVSKDTSVSFSVVYGVKNSIDTVGATGPLHVEHSEVSGSISMKYRF